MSEQQAIYGGTPAKPSADNLADRLAKEIAFQDSLKRRPVRLMRLLDEAEATLREQARRLAAEGNNAPRAGRACGSQQLAVRAGPGRPIAGLPAGL